MAMTSGLVSVEEAAVRIGCSVGAVRRWARQGRLKTVKLGRAVRVPTLELERVILHGIPAAKA
jgi:excisionase family DNA binding protein